jgi:hypothetical protein
MAAGSKTNNPNVVLNDINKAGRGSGSRTRAGEALLHFPAAPDKLGMGMLFAFKKFSYGGPGSKAKIATDVTQAHIALPLPENLVDSIGINYETTDLGVAALAFQAGAKTGKALKDFMSQQETAAEGKDAGGPGVSGTAEYVLRSMAQVSGALGGMLNLASGNVPNPFQTAIFKNVEIRQHNFTFRLVPETPEDSVMIAKIISEFKFHALPGGTAGSAFLAMPDEVDVMFFGTNALYGFARCVIKRVQVNYAPQNVPAFFKNIQESNLIGAPQAVELQIELSEIEQLTKASYEDEFKSLSSLSATQSPEGAESVPSAEQPGNKLRSGTSNPPARYDGGEPLVTNTPQPVEVELPEGTRYFPDDAAYDAWKADPDSVDEQNVGDRTYYTLPDQTTEGTVTQREFKAVITETGQPDRYFKSQAAYDAYLANPNSVVAQNIGGKTYYVLPGDT